MRIRSGSVLVFTLVAAVVFGCGGARSSSGNSYDSPQEGCADGDLTSCARACFAPRGTGEVCQKACDGGELAACGAAGVSLAVNSPGDGERYLAAKCKAGSGTACTELLLRAITAGQALPDLEPRLGKACELGDEKACFLVGMAAVEHGDRARARAAFFRGGQLAPARAKRYGGGQIGRDHDGSKLMAICLGGSDADPMSPDRQAWCLEGESILREYFGGHVEVPLKAQVGAGYADLASIPRAAGWSCFQLFGNRKSRTEVWVPVFGGKECWPSHEVCLAARAEALKDTRFFSSECGPAVSTLRCFTAPGGAYHCTTGGSEQCETARTALGVKNASICVAWSRRPRGS